MDLTGDVPIKVTEQTVMVLHRRNGIHTPFLEIIKERIPFFFLFPIPCGIVRYQLPHTVIEPPADIPFPICTLRHKVAGIVAEVDIAIGVADSHPPAHPIILIDGFFPFRCNDQARVGPISLKLPDGLIP